jgi:hypothetical protein
MIYYSIINHEVSSVIGTLYTLFCAPVRNRGRPIRPTERSAEPSPPSTAIKSSSLSCAPAGQALNWPGNMLEIP